ncbi:HET-domain-containing protein [Xylariaceae sp. AK1471]|nr:HET-domain-containing protein [Xylariaceae sp. AK1471]
MSMNGSVNLCKRCSEVDLDDLFQKIEIQGNGMIDSTPAFTLGQITPEYMSSSCALCQFFLSMIPAKHRTSPDARYTFHKASYVLRPCNFPLRQRTCLIARGPGLKDDFEGAQVNCSKAPESASLLDQTRVNYEPLRKWCSRFQEFDAWRDEKADMTEFPLRVIDCSTRELVPVHKGCRYVALSYVWGAAASQNWEAFADSNTLPPSLPATVEDAMVVVSELGLCYLWVDRYCLDRRNAAEFQSQLNSMAGVYRNAVATIVGAAGSDADYGLPGVGRRARVRQPCVSIGDFTLYSTMTDPRKVVRESLWMSRAWTYQEAIFSRNWLVFTDEQVFYQRSNTELSHQERGWQVSCEMLPEGGLGMMNPACPLQMMFDDTGSPGGLHQQLTRYTARKLSYQSDALNGMLGIWKRYGNGPYPMNHYFGVPILGPLEIYRLVSARAVDRQWTLTEAFLVGLCWRAEKTGQRRREFPSWSWAGWKSVYKRPDISIMSYGLSTGGEIKVELFIKKEDRFVEWEKMCYAKDWDLYEDISTLPQQLHLRTHTAPLRVGRAPEMPGGRPCKQMTTPPLAKWCAIFSDDECEVYIESNVADSELESKLNNGELVTLKGVFLRQMEVNHAKFSEAIRTEEVLYLAIMVIEGREGATRVGSLELKPSNYYVSWKREVEHPKIEKTTEWVDGNKPDRVYKDCYECRERAILALRRGLSMEMVNLI